MQTIRLNSHGAQVSRWQFFLLGLGYTAIKADGKFGPKTNQATIDFQQKMD
ncbi:MAG: peptidoglycan-binding protein [Saprospiraceae bacterium]|nr:peptidoglycan-binding protein [Saprospiraceae bacterium]